MIGQNHSVGAFVTVSVQEILYTSWLQTFVSLSRVHVQADIALAERRVYRMEVNVAIRGGYLEGA